ncbi:MAG: FtsW/RodA/SpoVE family cell cycle protein, partial [Christensenellaceae bacterium]
MPLFVAVVVMALFGIVMVYSASSYTAKTLYQDEFFFVKKQIVGFIMGLAGMVGLSLYDCRKLISLRYVLLPISLVLLALVFVPGIGKSNYGAARWIGFGSVTIQPSEIAKYAFVLFFAGFVAKDPRRIRSVKGLLLLLAGGGAVCALIIMEPNLSVTLCIGMLMMALLFVGGAKLSHLACLIVPAIVALPLLIVAEPYRLKRLMAFLDPWANPQEEGYQLIQSLYALGNGGWFGTGLFA